MKLDEKFIARFFEKNKIQNFSKSTKKKAGKEECDSSFWTNKNKTNKLFQPKMKDVKLTKPEMSTRLKRFQMQSKLSEIQTLIEMGKISEQEKTNFAETKLIHKIFAFFFENWLDLFHYYDILEKISKFVFCDVTKLKINPFISRKKTKFLTKETPCAKIKNQENRQNQCPKNSTEPWSEIKHLFKTEPEKIELKELISSKMNALEKYSLFVKENQRLRNKSQALSSEIKLTNTKKSILMNETNFKQSNKISISNKKDPFFKKVSTKNENDHNNLKNEFFEEELVEIAQKNLKKLTKNALRSEFHQFIEKIEHFDFDRFSNIFEVETHPMLQSQFIPYKFLVEEFTLLYIEEKTKQKKLRNEIETLRKKLKSDMPENSSKVGNVKNDNIKQKLHNFSMKDFLNLKKEHFELIQTSLAKHFEMNEFKNSLENVRNNRSDTSPFFQSSPKANQQLFVEQKTYEQLRLENEKLILENTMIKNDFRERLKKKEHQFSTLKLLYRELESFVHLNLSKILGLKPNLELNFNFISSNIGAPSFEDEQKYSQVSFDAKKTTMDSEQEKANICSNSNFVVSSKKCVLQKEQADFENSQKLYSNTQTLPLVSTNIKTKIPPLKNVIRKSTRKSTCNAINQKIIQKKILFETSQHHSIYDEKKENIRVAIDLIYKFLRLILDEIDSSNQKFIVIE